MGPSYYDTEPSPLPGRAALQFAATVHAPLWAVDPGPHTQPQVHESWPMGLEAAQPCRGWCERQGRGCDRDCNIRRDNTDDGYRSRPVPLRDEHVTTQMIGTAWAHGLVGALAVLCLTWAAHEWLLPVVRQWAMGWF